jgi:hypothetical protein
MSPRSDDEIDYLLSRGKLGAKQRQRIFDAALSASRDGLWARWRGRLGWSAGGLMLATGVAVALLVLRAPDRDAAGFGVKGASGGTLITVACLGAEMTACPSGSKLAFAIEGGRDNGGFLTAYAEPIGPGERIWYLSNEPVGAPQGDGARVLKKAAVIGDGQPAGRYRVHAIFVPGPVVRETLTAGPRDDALARVELELVVAP